MLDALRCGGRPTVKDWNTFLVSRQNATKKVRAPPAPDSPQEKALMHLLAQLYPQVSGSHFLAGLASVQAKGRRWVERRKLGAGVLVRMVRRWTERRRTAATLLGALIRGARGRALFAQTKRDILIAFKNEMDVLARERIDRLARESIERRKASTGEKEREEGQKEEAGEEEKEAKEEKEEKQQGGGTNVTAAMSRSKHDETQAHLLNDSSGGGGGGGGGAASSAASSGSRIDSASLHELVEQYFVENYDVPAGDELFSNKCRVLIRTMLANPTQTEGIIQVGRWGEGWGGGSMGRVVAWVVSGVMG